MQTNSSMNSTIEQLLKVQEVDSEIHLVKESLRLRPLELEDDRRRVRETQRALDALDAQIKQLRLESESREMDVRKADQEIEKYNIALNQAKSNQEYSVLKEQIRRQEEQRGKAEEEVLDILTRIDQLDAERKELRSRLAGEEKTLQKRTGEVEQIVSGLQGKLAELNAQREEHAAEIDRDHLKIYERVLARHDNFAIARVEDQVCQGCYISVTAQEVNLLMQGQFVQCRSCSRLLYLP